MAQAASVLDRITPQPDRTATPGSDAAYNPRAAGLIDFYPSNMDAHARLLTWCLNAFDAADKARQPFESRWRRYYKLYRSYVERKAGDWHSKVFIPMAFSVVETITPRLVSSLPEFRTLPVGPEDVGSAKQMERLLNIMKEQANLYVEITSATKSALKYGSGILKQYERQDVRHARRRVEVKEPITRIVPVPATDPATGMPLTDVNGDPMVESREVQLGEQVTGYRWEIYPYTAYDGPASVTVDIFNFWPAPEATSIEDARFVIHRTYKELAYIKRRIKEGVYRLPDEVMLESLVNLPTDDPLAQRLGSVQLDGGRSTDPTRKPVELLEIWTDDGRVITLANRRAILRAHENPFDHGMKPFVLLRDYPVEHEFWGIGEIEILEGLQDLENALTNQRIDNLRLVLNQMFAANTQYLEDLRDLRPRPGGVIRVKGDLPINQVLEPISLGDVTPNAFREADMIERTSEKVTGVTAYQIGLDSPSMNDTATGVSIISEAGATRFALKVRLMELEALRPLARQWGGLIQQFTSEPRLIRILGPEGRPFFETFDPAALMGSLDYDVETRSSAQSESQRRQDALTMLQIVGPQFPPAIPKLLADLLDSFGKKDLAAYLGPQIAAMVQAGFAPPPPGQEQPGMGMLGGMGMGMGPPPGPGPAGPGPGGPPPGGPPPGPPGAGPGGPPPGVVPPPLAPSGPGPAYHLGPR